MDHFSGLDVSVKENAVIWLWRAGRSRIASHMDETLWYVLPSLPMFPLFSAAT